MPNRRLGSIAVACWLLLLPGTLASGQEQDQQPAPEQEEGPVAGRRPSPIPESAPGVRLERVAQGLAVPVFLSQPDDDTDRLFVVDQTGQIRIVEDGSLVDEPFLDLSDRIVELDPAYDERGLLGLAFHPDYRENGRLFVYYSAPLRDQAPDDWDHTSHLSEFRVDPEDPNRADPGSERIIMQIDEPYSNHNAGHIGFGPDGYLYVPLGDGGDAADTGIGHPPLGNGQDVTTLLGSILRIDVDGEEPYGIPPDNPFAGGGTDLPDDQPYENASPREEIWAYGFRNPYAMSFDLETGDVYVADAGQALMESGYLVEPGGNHGWNIREGTLCFDPENQTAAPGDCPDEGPMGEPLVPPIVEYRRGPDAGSVIVATIRYRGDEMSEYRGDLLLGDYSRIRYEPDGVVYLATPQDERPLEPELMRVANRVAPQDDGTLRRFVIAIAQDLDGELYLLTTRSGGPSGESGEVFALTSPGEDGAAAGAVDPLLWWIGGGTVLLLAILAGAFLLGRRGGTAAPAGARGGT